jgi:AcrR family transcriptional regulator
VNDQGVELLDVARRDTAKGATALRADARRNRDRLIEAATQAFTERGVNASLEEIARKAGVGTGTLYRHFPTREALIEIVYRRETEALHAAAEEMARSLPADQALAQWMQRSLDYMATKRGLGESLRVLLRARPDLLAPAQGSFPHSVQRLVQAAIDQGGIREDVDASDILQALSGIYSAPESPDWRTRSGRVLQLFMDGLRTGRRGSPDHAAVQPPGGGP